MKTYFSIQLPDYFEPLTIRQLLKYWLVPRKWQHLLRIQEKILVNQRYHHFDELVHGNDLITLDFDFLPTNTQSYLPDDSQRPTILFEDETTLVLNKPAGIKTHPNRPDETGTMLNYLQANSPNVLIVHRLDQQTSGALLIAKSTVVVPIYNRQLSSKMMKRDYLAWIEHPQLPDSGTLTGPIASDPNDIRKFRVDPENGLPATTHFQVLKRTDHAALVKLTLETGRTHQLRVHLSHFGHPIIGDPLYNDNTHPNDKMLLHGYQLSYEQPFGFHTIQRVQAPLPTYFPK
ncbi:pseudouridylate synthase, 23S RNA-specific [Lapidilactobacillus concavus DSM 17758]|uniref:Pseudouridine synthase n=1 Tax=Lapidilactobacillus concavus DSM 17758 TaxID=1423735 RepID=A0A0R1W4B4_9LACO|nr:RluA family pseudouridine synthase [Lapidilactobacillus concavus]KRM10971.1 pseudouridylate synthase, 23S RNA-specific [Lapidilactobacillus concavus DSM 17758]GEL13917.1 pseudouridine synthase [Lapidilactobacillus concavus]